MGLDATSPPAPFRPGQSPKTPKSASRIGWRSSFDQSRRRPTLPGHLYPSTIGAERLNFRVRDGNGCDPLAMATGNRLSTGVPPEDSRASTSDRRNPSPRPISTGRLNVLPHLHLRPINVVVWPRALLR